MGDPTGNVRPRGRALSRDEITDVVERYDARTIVASRIAGDANVENAVATVQKDGRLSLKDSQTQRTSLLPDRGYAVLGAIQRKANKTLSAAQQTLGCGVRDSDHALVVDAQNAGRHPGQHRLDEGAPFVVEGVRL